MAFSNGWSIAGLRFGDDGGTDLRTVRDEGRTYRFEDSDNLVLDYDVQRAHSIIMFNDEYGWRTIHGANAVSDLEDLAAHTEIVSP